jgi:GNAT superfamily N-acetyltransferase
VTRIRPWRPASDLTALVAVSRAADELFAQAGLPLPQDDPAADFRSGRCVLVADAPPPVGFAILTGLDGDAHLAQLGVHPAHGRRGLGARLLAAACDWAAGQGYPALTLTTFADLPFNAPFYARHGFTELPPERWGPQLRAQWAAEEPIRVAPRIAMLRPLRPYA